MPEPGPGQVRIKVIQVGVCGTDLHIHNGEFMAAYPLTPGHELVGTVDALGEGADRFRIGEQVTVNPNVHCGRCDYCLSGRLILCSGLKGMGSNFPGFFAEYVAVPENLVFSVEGLPARHRRVRGARRVRHPRPGEPACPTRVQRAGLRGRSDRPAAGPAASARVAPRR